MQLSRAGARGVRGGDGARREQHTSHVDLRSLQGRLPMYLPSISLRALAPSAASLKLTNPYPVDRHPPTCCHTSHARFVNDFVLSNHSRTAFREQAKLSIPNWRLS